MFEVLKYIHDNVTAKLDLYQVADHFGYSYWYFCSKFRKYTKMSFVEYVRHYKMQMASLDILSGKSIQHTSDLYGYDSVVGFNKAFLKEFGCFPGQYTKKAKEAKLYYERKQFTMFNLSDR